jgi:site-specific DNA recombinase
MPMIGAAYLRCSDPRQDKSIDQQREEILRRAEADGVTIPPGNWFIDEGISGRSTKRRASYLHLIKRAEAQRDGIRAKKRGAHQIDRLYVWAFSRVARNMFDCLRALATLDEADIDVVSLTEPDAGDRSFRKLIRPILAWLAERYSEELSRNVVRGMKSQAEKGYWQHGHAPYGYAIVDGRLIVTDDVRPQFEVVKQVFRETLDGVGGARALADRLTRAGIQPPGRADMPRQYAAGTWRAKHVASILTNPLYCGHLVYDGEIAARSVHEAAVTDEDFARVLAIRALKARNRDEGEGNGENPITASQRGVLTPFLRCASCGGPICVTAGGQPKKRTYLYTCRSRQESSAACSGITIRVEKLDAMVLDAIEAHVLTPEALDTILANALVGLADTQVDALASERERLTSAIAELDRKIRLTATHAINGMIDEGDAKAITAPLIAQRDHLRLQLAALPVANPAPETDTIDPDAFREAVREAWRAQPLEERRHALSRVVEKVELSPGGLEIVCRADGYHGHDPFGPPSGACPRNRGWWKCERVGRPRGRAPARSLIRQP